MTASLFSDSLIYGAVSFICWVRIQFKKIHCPLSIYTFLDYASWFIRMKLWKETRPSAVISKDTLLLIIIVFVICTIVIFLCIPIGKLVGKLLLRLGTP